MIEVLRTAVDKAKIGHTDKQEAVKALSKIAQQAEKNSIPGDNLDEFIEQERRDSWKYGGKTVFADSKPPEDVDPVNRRKKGVQLRLF